MVRRVPPLLDFLGGEKEYIDRSADERQGAPNAADFSTPAPGR